ncbi:MAG: di-heme oxidoredictase family protein [Pseudomonadota bacterium]
MQSHTPQRPAVSDKAFGHALPHADTEQFLQVIHGKALFNRSWTQSQGLGPHFNASACADCHFRDGRGAPDNGSAPLIYRLERADGGQHLPLGPQLQERSLLGAGEGWVSVTYKQLNGQLADGSPYALLRPRYTLRAAQVDAPLTLGPRIPPALVGLGLLEGVPVGTILEWADPHDQDGDGVSGRASWQGDPTNRQLGRFGWRASQTSLKAQIAGALREDMGLQTPREVSPAALSRLVTYVRLLAPPAARVEHPLYRVGQSLFEAIGCASCHRPTLEASDPVDASAKRTIYPYTDLLLHDLGPALGDGEGRREQSREWRTAPLWGLGLLPVVNGELRLLHDGRARSFEQAILWHGGEADGSREAYRQLPAQQRKALLAFLRSI